MNGGAPAPGADLVPLDAAAPTRSRRAGRASWLAVALVTVPFVVALGDVLFNPSWKASIDYALIELRTRDIGAHWVLVGAWSRFLWNHPGPALYYLLVGPYRLLGSRYSGLQVGALFFNWICVAGVVTIARRRGGVACGWITAALVLALLRSLGDLTRSPWNADMPVLGLLLLVFVVWTITCGDVKLLPVAFGLASLIVQTHVGYALLALVLTAWAVVGVLLVRRDLARTGSHLPLAGPVRWSAIVVAVLWLPPLADEVFGTGNLSSLWRFFTGSHRTQSFGYSWHAVADQLSFVPEWVTGARPTAFFRGVALPGAAPVPIALVGTAIALAAAWRRSPAVRSLAITVLLGIAASVVSVSRVTGPVYPWLIRFTWVLGTAAWLVTLWGIAEAMGWWRARVAVVVSTVAVIAAVALVVVNGIDQATVTPPRSSALLNELMTPEVREAVSDGGAVYVGTLRADGKLAQGDFTNYYGSPGVADVLEHWGVPVRVPRRYAWLYGSSRAQGSQDARTQLLVVPSATVESVATATGCQPFTTARDAALFLTRIRHDGSLRCVAPPNTTVPAA